ncbi:hypothetical protein MAIT1_04650 [Magnetofaba australis IT-1]|uniref:Uncharacterized protein n=2 Tax=Magnetofaba TaxID=1472292 RepID=A0A1Y2KCG9_9PROT|nr:hypothetical protein MAIT1_04650 [Magnetofaba australis IT-1]
MAREATLKLSADLTAANPHNPAWFYTWMASRDRFRSLILDKLTLAARWDALLATPGGATQLASAVSDPFDARMIAAIARRHGWRVKIAPRARLHWLRQALILRFKPLLHCILELLRHWAILRAARRAPLPSEALRDHDLLSLTLLHAGPLNRSAEAGRYSDAYLGPLPHHAQQRGLKTLVIGGIIHDADGSTAAARRVGDITVASVGDFLTPWDLLTSAARAFFTRIRIPQMPPGLAGVDLRALTRWDLRREAVVHKQFCYMTEAAARRALRWNPLAGVVMLYENNPWEKAWNRLCAQQKRPSLGFLHCAVLPSHLKNYVAEEERRHRPAPGVMFCTGPEARRTFLTLGAHDRAWARAGCALRGPDLSGITPQRAAPPRKIRTLIALMDGLAHSIDAVRLLDAIAREIPSVRILLRGHPVDLPTEQLAQKSGVALTADGPFGASEPKDLNQAILQADAALYVGSTAVMNAVALGLPVIHLRINETLENDPLFQAPYLHRAAGDAASLQAAIAHFEQMPQTQFETELQQARENLVQTFTPVTEPGMDAMLAALGHAL